MSNLLRLALAVVSGVAGLTALILAISPGILPDGRALLIVAITVLLVTTLVGAALDGLRGGRSGPGDLTAKQDIAAASGFDSELNRIIALLQGQQDANTSFTQVLDKARDQLPGCLQQEQVRLVVVYLMAENEKMRSRTAELQSSLESSQRQIEKLTSNLAQAEAQGLSDPLTGLKNRRGFDLMIAAEAATSRATARPLSLIMADIDHFKAVNDRYGHPAGDDVLRWFARILSNNMKGRDTVARYGGEEFAIILPQTSLDNATKLAGQIRTQLEAELWKKPGAPNTMLKITASFGVAQLGEGEGTGSLVQRADAKLYESKSSGRNRVAA